MRQTLDKALRNTLEKTVVQARDIVEKAATETLERLGVGDAKAPDYLNEIERKVRTRLRAHGRQLGDNRSEKGKQESTLLIREVAYEHWHRMLFSRYLEQNDLLMFDQHTSVTLEECVELAEDEADCADGWEYAGRLAQKMLPQIFRTDSPVFAFKLPINHIRSLEALVMGFDTKIFQASDSLGWCYQFWQSKRKDEVNASGVKIGARELSPVTQLFTEPYMVSYLLDNALGAWWAKRRLTQDDITSAHSENDLREWAAIEGVPLNYLRFVKQENEDGSFFWEPAAGGFDQWPDHLSEIKTLDPCCGSGHFLVAAFLMLVPMRMAIENLSAKAAVNAVLSDNVHGLELDQRCVELAAFALALEAWRYPDAGGYRALPELQIACTGLGINTKKVDWLALADGNPKLEGALDQLHDLFKQAPTLGSLIDPNKVKSDLFIADYDSAALHIQEILKTEHSNENLEKGIFAQGIARGASLLRNKYHLIITNPPYLKSGNQTEILRQFCEDNYTEAKRELATVFLLRCLAMNSQGGTSCLVLPQNWLFLKTYSELRKRLLIDYTWNALIKLGSGAFETISGEVVQAILLVISNPESKVKNDGQVFVSIDASDKRSAFDKAIKLRGDKHDLFLQKDQLLNPDFIISTSGADFSVLLGETAQTAAGLSSFDRPRFFHYFWEMHKFTNGWIPSQSTVEKTTDYGGCEYSFLWEEGNGQLKHYMDEKKRLEGYTSAIWRAGTQFWGSKGVLVSLMGDIPASIYAGGAFDQNTALLVPRKINDLALIWEYCRASDFSMNVRLVDQSLKVTTATLEKIPFEISHWKSQVTSHSVLPEPYTNDLTQWIFHGHPCGSVVWNDEIKSTAQGALRIDDAVLHVAVARLLGYRWPAEQDPDMELAPEMREWIQRCTDFDTLVDDDGIVCLAALRGEKKADDRLEVILQKAYGEQWSAEVFHNLRESVNSSSLESWLREKFFEQHCKIFQNRPFIWQIWDGLKDGFSALVNYHQFDQKGLDRLIYTYLGDWIRIQESGVNEGLDGAENRLTAARNLKDTLEKIKIGEEGLDIFVRWKFLEEQAIGWNPDLNDGVRLNIRAFMLAQDVGKKGAGVLRAKPNIHWKKDRGNDVESAPWYDLGPVYGEKEGSRINDHYLSLEEKRAAKKTT